MSTSLHQLSYADFSAVVAARRAAAMRRALRGAGYSSVVEAERVFRRACGCRPYDRAELYAWVSMRAADAERARRGTTV